VLVSLQNVTVGYDRHPAIHHLQLQISAGDMLAVVGPNGAGKSTFLKLLTGEGPPRGRRAAISIRVSSTTAVTSAASSM